MIFHTIENADRNVSSDSGIELSAKAKKKVEPQVNQWAIMWSVVIIVLFVIAALLAHAMQFATGETVFLNLVVLTTSGSAGAFLGEKLAVEKLLR